MTKRELKRIARRMVDAAVPSSDYLGDAVSNIVLNDLSPESSVQWLLDNHIGLTTLSDQDRESLADLMAGEAMEKYIKAFPQSV